MESDELFPSWAQSPFLHSYTREAFSVERSLTLRGREEGDGKTSGPKRKTAKGGK